MRVETFLKYADSPEWVLETLGMFRGILRRVGSGFPEHIAEPIAAALANAETRFDMTCQLLRLADLSPREHEVRHVELVDGQLLYVTGSCVAWGSDVFVPPEGFVVSYEYAPRMIGGKPCWVLRSTLTREERVVWAGRLGKIYPERSIGTPIDCGGVPCYAVNYVTGDERVGFVVVGETEGAHRESVDYLVDAGGRPAYVAYADRRYAFVWGDDLVCAGQHVGRPVVHEGVPYVDVRRDGDARLYDLWRGRERMIEGVYAIHGIAVVRGQIAYAFTRDGDASALVIAGEQRALPDIDRFWTNRARGENAFCAVTCWRGGLYANFTKLSDDRVEPNSLSLADDGTTLRVRLEGEREPRTFDLKALGIL